MSAKGHKTRNEMIAELSIARAEAEKMRQRVKEMEDSRYEWEAKMNMAAARQEPIRILRDFVRTLDREPAAQDDGRPRPRRVRGGRADMTADADLKTIRDELWSLIDAHGGELPDVVGESGVSMLAEYVAKKIGAAVQTLDTAPRDGSVFLAFTADFAGGARFNQCVQEAKWSGKTPDDRVGHFQSRNGQMVLWWMPRPPFPV